MLRKLKDNKGVSVIVWLLLVGIVVMAILIAFPDITDFGGKAAEAQDKAHETTCMDSAKLEGLMGSAFDGVYDAIGKKFVKLTEHPYKVQPYGMMKEHEDCVILVHCDGGSAEPQLSWISITTLKERYQ